MRNIENEATKGQNDGPNSSTDLPGTAETVNVLRNGGLVGTNRMSDLRIVLRSPYMLEPPDKCVAMLRTRTPWTPDA